jgi:23S rRNA (guanine745-N1)-methyltransferase
MSFVLHPKLRCPIDACSLAMDGASLVCEHSHRFDVARQGYVNLLGPKDKRSKNPGDSKEMVSARTAFLGADFYRPLAEACLDITQGHCSDNPDSQITLMDAGCGDGYYLDYIQKQLPKSVKANVEFIGFDISKWAVQQSARRFEATWFVGSNRHIPMADASVDLLFDMFGFSDDASFLRVLVPEGKVVRFTPADQHLIELRKIIYPDIKPRRERGVCPENFSVASERRITYDMTVGSVDLKNLILMTPHMFRSTEERRQQALDHDQLSLTVDIVISELTPTPRSV